jgi:hypothetical protein
MGDNAMPCEAKTEEDEGHKGIVTCITTVARELELGVTSNTEIGPLKYSFEEAYAAFRGLEGKRGAGFTLGVGWVCSR